MSDLPEPLTPTDCDLKDFQFIPVDVHRLLTSETWVLGNGDERAAAISLWLASWHQVPAASIPKADRMLAHLSQAGTKWAKVKEHALRGWIEAKDGRLYHPVVAEKALEAWIEKLANSISGANGNAKRWGVSIETDSIRERAVIAVSMLRAIAPQSKTLKKKVVAIIEAGSQPESGGDKKGSGGDSGGDRKGQGQGQGQGSISVPNGTGADAPPEGLSAHDAIFQVAVPWLLANGCKDSIRSLLGGAIKQLGDSGAWELASQCMREKPLEPTAWLAGAVNSRLKVKSAASGGRMPAKENLDAANYGQSGRL